MRRAKCLHELCDAVGFNRGIKLCYVMLSIIGEFAVSQPIANCWPDLQDLSPGFTLEQGLVNGCDVQRMRNVNGLFLYIFITQLIFPSNLSQS